MRAVIDTNVFIRALMNPEGSTAAIIRRNAAFTLVMSPPIIRELLRVARRPRLKKRFGARGYERAVAGVLDIVRRAHVVDPRHTPRVCRDESDDMFFACAVAGRADYIVSEDDDILAVAEYEGVRTIRTATFLKLLDEAAQ